MSRSPKRACPHTLISTVTPEATRVLARPLEVGPRRLTASRSGQRKETPQGHPTPRRQAHNPLSGQKGGRAPEGTRKARPRSPARACYPDRSRSPSAAPGASLLAAAGGPPWDPETRAGAPHRTGQGRPRTGSRRAPGQCWRDCAWRGRGGLGRMQERPPRLPSERGADLARACQCALSRAVKGAPPPTLLAERGARRARDCKTRPAGGCLRRGVRRMLRD